MQGTNVIVAVIVKNEYEYIREFVDYHLGIGFDQIVIGDNNDKGTKRYEPLLAELIVEGKVKVVDMRGMKNVPLSFYRHVMNSIPYSWCAFIDCDEFITFGESCPYISVKDFTESMDYIQAYKMNWKMYGDNGRVRKGEGGVLERFTEPMPDDFTDQYPIPQNCHCKCMLRWDAEGKWITPHSLTGCKHYTTMWKPVDDSPFIQEPDYRMLYIRHYYTKSLEEWVKYKYKRGYADNPNVNAEDTYPIERYFKYNGKTEEMLKFLKKKKIQLKEEICQ